LIGDVAERILSMRFDNRQFQKNIKDTVDSLKDFKEAMNFDGASESFDGLSETVETFKDDTSSTFDDLKGAMLGTFEDVAGMVKKILIFDIGRSVYSWGKNMVKALSVDQISAGYSKYEDYIRSSFTIANATGKSIDEVDDALERLMWFTDETSYSFTDMTDNVGKFTSQGIELDDAIIAMQGIALAAADAGQGTEEASRAMYNFAQALGAGSVKLMDWKSIENANMATEDFKQTIIDTAIALGVLREGGITKRGTKVTAENFSSTLAEGWFNSDVLMESLKKYGNYATVLQEYMDEHGIDTASEAMAQLGDAGDELGFRAFKAGQEARSFADAINAVKDAVSTGWLQTFKLLVGNTDEATVLFTDLANSLWDVFAAGGEARNELLQKWIDKGGREEALQGIYDLLSGIWDLIQTISDAFFSMIPDVTVDNLMDISHTIGQIGKTVKETFGFVEKTVSTIEDAEDEVLNVSFNFDEQIEKGLTGDSVKHMQEWLEQAGYSVGHAGIDGIFGPDTEAALKKFQEDTGLTVNGIYDDATHFALGKALFGTHTVQYLKPVETTITELTGDGEKVSRIFAGVGAAVDLVLKIGNTLWTIGKSVIGAFKPLLDVVVDIAAAVGDFFVSLDQSEGTATVFNGMIELANIAVGYLSSGISVLADIIRAIFLGPQSLTTGNETLKKFANWCTKIKDAIKNSKVGKWFSNLSTSFGQFVEDVKENGFISTVKDWFIQSWENTKTYFESGQAWTDVQATWEAIKSAVKGTVTQAIHDLFAPTETDSKEDAFYKQTWLDTLMGAWESVTLFFETFPEQVQTFFDTIHDSEWWQWITDKYTIVKNAIVNFFTTLFGGESSSGEESDEAKKSGDDKVSSNLGTLGRLTETLQLMWKTISNFFTSLWESVSGVYETITNSEWWNTTKEKVLETKDAVVAFFTSLFFSGESGGDNDQKSGDNKTEHSLSDIEQRTAIFHQIWDVISGFFVSLWERVVSVYDKVTNSEWWINAKEKIIAAKNAIVDFFTNLFSSDKGDEGSKLVDGSKIGQDNATSNGGGFWAGVRRWLPFLIGLGVVLGLYFTIVSPILDLINTPKKTELTKAKAELSANHFRTLLMFAITVAVIATAIYVLGTQMSLGQLAQGFLAIVAIVALIVGTLVGIDFLTKKLQINTGAVTIMAGSMLMIAGVIAIVGVIAYLLGNMDIGVFWTGMARIAAILVLLGLFVVGLNKLNSVELNLKGLIEVGVAIAILGGVAIIMGLFPWPVLIRGIIAVGALLAIMMGFVIGVTRLGKTADSENGLGLKGIMAVAIAVAILGAVALVLGIYPWQNSLIGIGMVAILMGLLLLFVWGLKAINKEGELKITGIIGIASALAIMAIIVVLLGLIPADALARGLVAIVVLGLVLAGLAGLGILLKKQNFTTKDMGPLLIVAGILAVLMGLLILLAKTPIPQLQAATFAMVAIAAAIVAITAMTLITSKLGGNASNMSKAALGIGASFAIIVGIVTALVAGLGLIDRLTGGNLLRDMIRGGAVLRALAKALEPFTDNMSLALVAGGMLLASVGVGALSSIPGVNGFTIAGGTVLGAAAISVSFGLIISVLTAVVGGIGAIDDFIESHDTKGKSLVDYITEGGNVLAALGGALASFGYGFSVVTSEGLSALGQGISDLRSGVAGLDEDYNVGSLDDDLITAMAIWVKMREFFVERAKKEGADKENQTYYDRAASLANEISGSIEKFGEAMGVLRIGINGMSKTDIDADKDKAIEIATALDSFFQELTPLTTVSLPDGSYVATPDLLSDAMTNFGLAIGSFSGQVGGISEKYPNLETDTSDAISAAGQVKTFMDSLQPDDYEEDPVQAYSDWVDSFSDSMNNLSITLSGWAARIGEFKGKVTDEDTTAAINAMTAVSEFINTTNSTVSVQRSTWLGGLVGKKSPLDTILEYMDKFNEVFGDKFRENFSGFSDLTDEDSEMSKSFTGVRKVVEDFATFFQDMSSYNIEKDPAWYERLFGTGEQTNITQILSDIKKMNLSQYTVSGVKGDLAGALTSLDQLGSFFQTMSAYDLDKDQTWIQAVFGTGEKTNFQQVIDNLGRMDFSSFINSENPNGLIGLAKTSIVEDINTAIEVLENIGLMTQKLDSTLTNPFTGQRIDPFSTANNVGSALDVFKTYLTDFSSEEFSSVYGNIQTLQENITSLVSAFDTDLPTAIDGSLAQSIKNELDNMVAVFGNASPSAVTPIEQVCSGFKLIFETALSNANQSIRTGFYGQFATTGEYLAIGVANGLRRQKANIKTAAAEIIRAALQSMAEEGKIKSPSRATYEFGMYMIQGLRNGLRDYSDEATNTSGHVITDMIETMSSLLSEDMDLTPRITPVLDMSNVSTGVSKMNGLFGQRSLNLGTSVGLAKSVTQNNQNGTIAKAFGNSDVVSAIGALKDEVNTLKANIGGLKVYMDSGALVGQIGPKMDGYLGHRAALERRRG